LVVAAAQAMVGVAVMSPAVGQVVLAAVLLKMIK
jgi:hypothetical protein